MIEAGAEVAYTVTWLEMTQRPEGPWPHQPSGPPASLLVAEAPPAWYFLAALRRRRPRLRVGGHACPPGARARGVAGPARPSPCTRSCARAGRHGFFVIDATRENIVDLAYFGLAPQAVGTGLGRFLLGTAIHTAWDLPGIRKLTVNTCTLDHPRALGLYQKLGFVPVRREERRRILTRPIPEPPC